MPTCWTECLVWLWRERFRYTQVKLYRHIVFAQFAVYTGGNKSYFPLKTIRQSKDNSIEWSTVNAFKQTTRVYEEAAVSEIRDLISR